MQKIIVLDTETCDLQGNVYDVGLVVTDRTGTIYHEYHSLVREVFTDAERMMGAFYARKMFTHYAPMLDTGETTLTPWAMVADTIRQIAGDYQVKTVAAYNLGFDERVLRNMGRQFRTAPLFGDTVRELDIWQFACEVRLNRSTYRNIAEANGWVSPKGNIKTGAEFAYRFLSGQHDFIEDHTALSDARIEVDIMRECFKQKRKVPYGVSNAAPWRLVQKKAAA
jgi:hypothetical protein